jgi:hypothetical protein
VHDGWRTSVSARAVDLFNSLRCRIAPWLCGRAKHHSIIRLGTALDGWENAAFLARRLTWPKECCRCLLRGYARSDAPRCQRKYRDISSYSPLASASVPSKRAIHASGLGCVQFR